MDYKYTSEIVNKTATMLLYSEIGGFGTHGEEFARELNFLLNDPIETS